MASQCSICLSDFDDPVCIPCGHVYCFSCLNKYANSDSNEGLSAPCPDCRAEFQLVTPDPRILPQKYHPFIAPHMRRVFLESPAGTPSQELQKKNEQLKTQVSNLRRREETLLLQCERHIEQAHGCRAGEQKARMELANVTADFKDIRSMYQERTRKYKDLKKKYKGLERKFAESEAREVNGHDEAEIVANKMKEMQARNEFLELRCKELEAQVLDLPNIPTPASIATVRVRVSRRAKRITIETPREKVDTQVNPSVARPILMDSAESELEEGGADEEPSVRSVRDDLRIGTPNLRGLGISSSYTRKMADALQSDVEEENEEQQQVPQLKAYETPARMRITRPLPRRRIRVEDAPAAPGSHKRARLSEPVLPSNSMS